MQTKTLFYFKKDMLDFDKKEIFLEAGFKGAQPTRATPPLPQQPLSSPNFSNFIDMPHFRL